MSPEPTAIVLVFEGLGAGYLGPYGNTWLDTPIFNHIASRSLLFEHALIDSPRLGAIYRSYWQGRHALCRPGSGPSLAACCGDLGASTLLISDQPAVLEHPLANAFQQAMVLPVPSPMPAAAEVEETELAGFFFAVTDELRSARAPFLCWIHTSGLRASWDAPWSWRAALADPDDPPPPRGTIPAEATLAADEDPDRVLGIVQAYGAQVAVADAVLAPLWELLEQHPRLKDALVIITATCGYPLGEHRQVGYAAGGLFSELLQVPLLVRYPGADLAAIRSQSLSQPADVFATLADWFGVGVDVSGTGGRCLREKVWDVHHPLAQRAIAIRAEEQTQEQVLRTPSWMYRERARHGLTAEDVALFAKPDDRWDANEISDRCPGTAEALRDELASFRVAAERERLHELKPLPRELSSLDR